MAVCDVVPFPPDPKLELDLFGTVFRASEKRGPIGYESRGPAAKLECLSKSSSLFSGQRKAVLLRSSYMRF